MGLQVKLRYCKDCVWSVIRIDPYDRLKCTNSYVNATDAWELSAITIKGKDCTEERSVKGLFSVCGLKGKLFEAK